MTTTPTTTSTTGTAPVTDDSTLVNPSSILGKDDFLKLLVAQLQHQDPLQPTDQSQFMSQMAQFSTVEGLTNLQSSMTSMNQSTAVSQAVGLIGKEITYVKADGSTASGTAGSVSLDSGAVTVHIGDTDVALGDVIGIADASGAAAGA
jgi:flagellar basal-body rod modification protein FlgD